MYGKEKHKPQKLIRALGIFMFLAGFLLAGFSYRFGWLQLPDWISWIGAVFFLLSYLLYAEVMRENTYLSRTVEVQKDQKVIDTGLYAIVRHPMYAATIILSFSIALVLGSGLSFIIALGYPILLAKRIKNEETVLENGLSGYTEYKHKVKYKIIPYIW